MLALYVHSPCCRGVSFHVDMLDHLRDVETDEESTVYWFLLDGRYLATYAAQKAPGPSAAEDLVYYVPGVVVWKGRRIAATSYRPTA